MRRRTRRDRRIFTRSAMRTKHAPVGRGGICL